MVPPLLLHYRLHPEAMPFKTAKPYEDLRVTEGDMLIASLAFGWTLGFGYFVVCNAVRETRRTHRVNVYVVLIWSQIAVSLAFAIICWLYLRKIIPHSFAFFFSILTLWALQVQLLLQIIVNRICILLRNEKERNMLKYGVAGLILLINISVYNIWLPSKLQINQRYISINIWWDRIEKCLYLVVDGMLNYFFIRSVKQRLVSHGLKKYDKLVRYNIRIVGVSLAMDVLIIGMMSLVNDFVYMQFHSVAYTVKLNIEMSMSQLIIKVARSTGIRVFDLELEDCIVDMSKETRSGPMSGGRSEHIRTEVHVDRHVFTQHDGQDDMEMQPKHWTAIMIKSQASDDAIIDKKVPENQF
ncbi:hypothetical protein B0H10DRAFT_1913893 [Mycena sp. CBHHK59/15]|nr:hypothetical protein B0H10DRAFT_1913893 [Mycena sp. CBHHK59/15]